MNDYGVYAHDPEPNDGPVRMVVRVEIHGDPKLLAACNQSDMTADRSWYVRKIMLYLRTQEFKEDYEEFVRTGRSVVL